MKFLGTVILFNLVLITGCGYFNDPTTPDEGKSEDRPKSMREELHASFNEAFSLELTSANFQKLGILEKDQIKSEMILRHFSESVQFIDLILKDSAISNKSQLDDTKRSELLNIIRSNTSRLENAKFLEESNTIQFSDIYTIENEDYVVKLNFKIILLLQDLIDMNFDGKSILDLVNNQAE
jgi:hypothetical protein